MGCVAVGTIVKGRMLWGVGTEGEDDVGRVAIRTGMKGGCCRVDTEGEDGVGVGNKFEDGVGVGYKLEDGVGVGNQGENYVGYKFKDRMVWGL